MMGSEPKVSVCIPTYNRAGMLKEAIESVLAQTFQDFELIVSDNASIDDTETAVREFDDQRIIYTKQPRNLGARKNYNYCLGVSRGEYITILSDDDLMLPDNLRAKVEVLSQCKDVGLVHSKYHVIDNDGTISRYDTNWCHGPDRMCDALEPGREAAKEMVLTYSRINSPTALFRRACYERLGSFTDQLKIYWDWEYWVRIALYYDVAFIAKPYIKWRFHPSSQTSHNNLGSFDGFSPLHWEEHFGVKRLVIKRHLPLIPDGPAVKKQVWEEMSSKVAQLAEAKLGDGGPNPEVRTFILGMCRALPEIVFDKRVWKVFLKSILSPKVVAVLKRIA